MRAESVCIQEKENSLTQETEKISRREPHEAAKTFRERRRDTDGERKGEGGGVVA